MASKMDICNRALLLLGQDAIMSLSDNSPRARICFQEFEAALDATLRAYPWPFALKRAKLARLTDKPLFGFAYYYQLPVDCLRIVTLYSDDHTAISDTMMDSSSGYTRKRGYDIEGSKIATDAQALNLKYIAKTVPELLDTQTVEVVSYKLASLLTISLTENAELLQQLLQQHARALVEARNTCAVEDFPQIPLEGPWLRRR